MPADKAHLAGDTHNETGPRIVLVAGEASGDMLGARLMQGLRRRYPQARFAGIGGPQMVSAGMDAWHRSEELAVMGLVEVLRHLRRLLAIRRDVLARSKDWQPDLYIGIDAPDFNLGVERRLKQTGIRTAHYVSPSIWAWRSGRAGRIGHSADHILCIFPMEPSIYSRHGVAATFVGHPLADEFAMDPDQGAARAALGLDPGDAVLALLPGSRLAEINRLAPSFLAAAALLASRIDKLRIVVPLANEICRNAFVTHLDEHADLASRISLLEGRAAEALVASDAVLVASGTASLEAMLAKRPMVVAYRLAPLTYFIVRALRLLRSRRYSLPNVLAQRDLVPELMQTDATPTAMAEALQAPLRTRQPDAPLLAEYRRLHETLRGEIDAASVISSLLDGPAP